jgi:hypothetical protein
MFLLVILHNVFNRRWYGTASRARRERHGMANIDTGGEFISRRIDEPIRRMIGGIQDPSCCL